VIRLAVVAERQVAELFGHFGRLERPEAARDLLTALDLAIARISRDPTAWLTSPRSYPALARPDRAWLKSGRHWVTYSLTLPPVILGVFYETADIPKRINEIMEQTA
jgi:plasmid stabilization system protein ParE